MKLQKFPAIMYRKKMRIRVGMIRGIVFSDGHEIFQWIQLEQNKIDFFFF